MGGKLSPERKQRRDELKKEKEEENQFIIKSLQGHLDYIDKEIIGRQNNGKYCKFSIPANSITVTDLSFYKNLEYWLSLNEVKKAPPEYKDKLINRLVYKFFLEGLTPLDDIIKLEMNSKDSISEKERLVEEITRK